ncbi:Pao retrotransposon peptidase family protein [Dirofilaria immitis]|nr:Pao retrotransposon peptidase family protein [Dirofilaria immitis]
MSMNVAKVVDTESHAFADVGEQIQSNIIEEVLPYMNHRRSSPYMNQHYSLVDIIHYLSHYELLTSSKLTEKLRTVYDILTYLKGMKSLNDFLCRYPITLSDLIGVLLRFRAVETIELHPSERNCTRFLWLKNIQRQIIVITIQSVINDSASRCALNTTPLHPTQYPTLVTFGPLDVSSHPIKTRYLPHPPLSATFQKIIHKSYYDKKSSQMLYTRNPHRVLDYKKLTTDNFSQTIKNLNMQTMEQK